jgi:hypothetical protein
MDVKSGRNGKDPEKSSPAAASATALQQHQQTPTILPARIAQAVSFATRSTCLAIRAGSFVGTYGLDAARFTTLSSLELARGAIEGILSRAGRDVTTLVDRPQCSELAVAEAETVLERTLDSLHYAFSHLVFWTSAGFQLTGTTLSAASELSQLFLCSLDQLFGSTDSSRAIASIITLVRREFNNPATGQGVDKVGVIDLILATSALAYLQQRCRKAIEQERRTKAAEEIVWDVVVLDDGERIDVQDETMPPITPMAGGGEDNNLASDTESILSFASHQTRRSRMHDDEDERVLARLKRDISSSLAPGTTVSISNAVSTVQTITVDIDGTHPVSFPTPPGAEIIETKKNEVAGHQTWHSHDRPESSSYRVVYRLQRNKTRTTSFQHRGESLEPAVVELKDDSPVRPDSPVETESPSFSLPISPNIPIVPVSHSIVTRSDLALNLGGASRAPSRVENPGFRRSQTATTSGLRSPTIRSPTSPSAPIEAEPTANQKKTRTPLSKVPSRVNIARHKDSSTSPPTKKPLSSKKKAETPEPKPAEKKIGLKQVLKGSGQSISNMWHKEQANPDMPGVSLAKSRPQWKTPGTKVNPVGPPIKLKPPPLPRHTRQIEQRVPSRQSLYPDPAAIPRSSSRSSYVSVHDHRRDSLVSQPDSFSIRSRPSSPLVFRSEPAGHDQLGSAAHDAIVTPHTRGHRRGGSYGHSIYSLATNDSQTSLILSSYYQKSAYNATDAMSTLRRVGAVQGAFPAGPLLHNISRYMRFASASYGSHFLKLMGISNDMPSRKAWDGTHHDVRHFLHHTDSGIGNVLLASFVDHGGGSNSTGSTDSGVPLVHYISLDHEAKAVVLACRGTLGFEDVLADLTCEYDRLAWRGRGYKVHKGVHASARRILFGGDGKVLITLQEALKEFDDYGLVLCGHSLGGGVTALLGLMLSEPNPRGKGFVTVSVPQYKLKADDNLDSPAASDIRLPPGRPIHVFAYGPPGVMSSSLCKITRGLITTIVHGSDIVPYLSLGLLHDLQAAAVAFKKDEHQVKAEIRQRMWSAFHHNMADKLYSASPPSSSTDSNAGDEWMMPALNSLRSSMKSEKLLPPGEVFCIETQRVLRREAFLLADEERIGRPARRIVLRYVRDVGERFGELRFGTSMLVDHSPAKYEEALRKLRLGVSD